MLSASQHVCQSGENNSCRHHHQNGWNKCQSRVWLSFHSWSVFLSLRHNESNFLTSLCHPFLMTWLLFQYSLSSMHDWLTLCPLVTSLTLTLRRQLFRGNRRHESEACLMTAHPSDLFSSLTRDFSKIFVKEWRIRSEAEWTGLVILMSKSQALSRVLRELLKIMISFLCVTFMEQSKKKFWHRIAKSNESKTATKMPGYRVSLTFNANGKEAVRKVHYLTSRSQYLSIKCHQKQH